MNSYFDKSKVVEGTIQPSVPVQGQINEETKNIPSLIRTPETGDKVFLVKDGVAHWVMNPEAFDAINGAWDKVVAINRNKFKLLVMGERVTRDNADTYKLPKDEVVKEEFKVYDDSIKHERLKGLFSVVLVVTPDQYEALTRIIPGTSTAEYVLVVNGEKVLQENDPRFSFATRVVILKDEKTLDEAMQMGTRISTGEWILRTDLLHVK